MPRLVKTLKYGEEIVLDGPAKIRVEEIAGRRVKLVIQADGAVQVTKVELPSGKKIQSS